VLNVTALTESAADLVITRYYFAALSKTGANRVAMDREGVVQWLVGDHLGTTSVVLNANGTVHSEARHYPYGEERWSSGTLPTDYRFTGQRQDSRLGLYHMGARHYDSALGRWISADTLVPDLKNPQSFNRLAYALGNPHGYVDPSGRLPWKVNYWAWKASLDAVSAVGLAHGRDDIKQNAGFITSFAREEHQLIVAASIAHQGSDILERPFGTNGIERAFRLFKPNMSVGIAQLRPSEVEFYSPQTIGHDLQDPRIGVYVMADKIEFLDQYIQQSAGETGRNISQTDRFMLISIAQNGGNVDAARRPIDYFFEGSGHGWRPMFLQNQDWQDTLRLVVLQIEWLLTQGYELPEGVNFEEMKKTAFTDY
jgi:RHS repeat-associated protein